MMKKHGLPPSRRIRKSGEFRRIYESGQRAGDRHLLVIAAPGDLDHSRMGLSVSKKHGTAVRRARLKRLLREAFRLSQHDLPVGLDLVLIPRQDSGAGLEEYRRSLVKLAGRLAERLAEQDAAESPDGMTNDK